MWERRSVEAVILNRVGRILTEKVTFEKKFQGSKGINHMNSWWKNIPGKGEPGKSPKVGAFQSFRRTTRRSRRLEWNECGQGY